MKPHTLILSRLALSLCVLVPVGVASCASSRAVNSSESSESNAESLAPIRALIAETERANNSGDVDAWVDLFEPGAVYMPPGQPAVDSRDGLVEVARTGFTSWRSEIEIYPEEIVLMGDWAFARSQVRGTASPKAGGKPIAIDIKQLVIYHQQQNADWKIARLINNSNK